MRMNTAQIKEYRKFKKHADMIGHAASLQILYNNYLKDCGDRLDQGIEVDFNDYVKSFKEREYTANFKNFRYVVGKNTPNNNYIFCSNVSPMKETLWANMIDKRQYAPKIEEEGKFLHKFDMSILDDISTFKSDPNFLFFNIIDAKKDSPIKTVKSLKYCLNEFTLFNRRYNLLVKWSREYHKHDFDDQQYRKDMATKYIYFLLFLTVGNMDSTFTPYLTDYISQIKYFYIKHENLVEDCVANCAKIFKSPQSTVRKDLKILLNDFKIENSDVKKMFFYKRFKELFKKPPKEEEKDENDGIITN